VAWVSILAGDGEALCDQCELADTPLRRLRGLLGRDTLGRGEGLFLRPAPAIHTCFMRFPIDAVFLDRELRVVAISEAVRPWRFARGKGAHSVVELAAGECRRLGLSTGEQLELVPRPRPEHDR
jgi:uncharacterized membrane protein (UPF0127 family)